jgi:3-(3-hydroxy-phenyl)propionate hydroxylase
MRFKPKPSFSEGFLWKTSNKYENELIGQLFPQPIVDNFKGKQFLLDEILGNNFFIIIYSDSPEKFISNKLIKKFKTKNINILGIIPEYINPVQTTFKIVRDVSKTLSNYQYNRQLNKAFFIRPDKYIATITGADNYNSIYDLMDEFKIKLD